MLQSNWTERLPAAGDIANLTDLRGQLVSRMALLLIGGSGVMMWLSLTQDPFPLAGFTLLAIFLGLGLAINMATETRPVLARHLLVWGPTVVLLVAIDIFPQSWLPFLALGSQLERRCRMTLLMCSGGTLSTGAACCGTQRDSRRWHMN